ncbi:MAG: AAA family ATPase [Bdellovibrionales bacterium]
MIGRVLCLSLFLATAAQAESDRNPAELGNYTKAEILLARYGNEARQKLFAKALEVRTITNQHIVGQDHLAAALQIRLVQYLNSVGTRKEEPVALHIIGLPGVGKTSLLAVLDELGFPVVRLDAQKFSGGEQSGSSYFLMQALEQTLRLRTHPDQPLILFVDELDKVPEIKLSENGKEVSQPVIASLNEILSEGKLANSNILGRVMDFSNVFILTAMNFSPVQIESFSKQSLGKTKSFWDYTEADLAKFDKWIRSSSTSQSSVAKVMALLFRSNTISRMIPDAMVAKSLFADDFDQIVGKNIETVVNRIAGKSNRLQVTHTSAYTEFLRRVSVYAPSGARMTVKRVDLLTEQLVTVAMHANLQDDESLALPRQIVLDFEKSGTHAVIRIQALSGSGPRARVRSQGDVKVLYNSSTGSFELPMDALKPLPARLAKNAQDQDKKLSSRKITVAQVRTHRRLLENNHDLAKHLNRVIFGQPELASQLDENLHLYMNSEEEVLRYQTVPGFTGVGKSAIVIEAAKKLGIELVKLNMQHYSGDSQEAADRFAEDLYLQIEEAQRKSPKGKYILLLEETDKAFEIDPGNGSNTKRPAMAVLKDLLDKGTSTVTLKSRWDQAERKVIDIRTGYMVLTMNFPVDHFDLKADPRLTTIEDMQRVHHDVSSSPEALRSLFTSMFLPDTVNRLLAASTQVARPLDRLGYEQVLRAQINEALVALSSGETGKKNHGALKVEMTAAYFNQYLFAESVIPSEGGRQAANTAKTLLIRDLLEAVAALPKGSTLYGHPLTITLDYAAKSRTSGPRVLATARLTSGKASSRRALFKSPRKLRFPPVQEFGNLEAQRILITAHEFGHAMAAVMHGFRIEHAVAVSPVPSIGGYVKPKRNLNPTGATLLADLMVSLGSIAMERLIFSDTPTEPTSMLEISHGPNQDIQMATKAIWKIIHQYGMDPDGGIIERSGLKGEHRELYDKREYFFAELPDEKIEQLSLVVRDLVDHLVLQMQQAHSQDWYRTKIVDFARKGAVNEKELYALIDYPFPGENNIFLGEDLRVNREFKAELAIEPESVSTARRFKQGEHKKTASENMRDTLDVFIASLSKRLHPTAVGGACDAALAAGASESKK